MQTQKTAAIGIFMIFQAFSTYTWAFDLRCNLRNTVKSLVGRETDFAAEGLLNFNSQTLQNRIDKLKEYYSKLNVNSRFEIKLAKILAESYQLHQQAIVLSRELNTSGILYIHKGFEIKIDSLIAGFLKYEKNIQDLHIAYKNHLQTLNSETVSASDKDIYVAALEIISLQMRLETIAPFFKLLIPVDLEGCIDTKSISYNLFRFVQEGSRYKLYPKNILSIKSEEYGDLLDQNKENFAKLAKVKDLESILRKNSDNFFELYKLLADSSRMLNDSDRVRLSRSFTRYDGLVYDSLEKAGGKGVKFAGWVMKEVPTIKRNAAQRENYLVQKMEQTMSLVQQDLQFADILLEKDYKANSDLIIPGYWIHAAMYLGTIQDFKRLGLWESPEFAKIRYEIEQYDPRISAASRPAQVSETESTVEATNQLRKWLFGSTQKDFLIPAFGGLKAKGLNEKEENFESIPWFIESERGGVDVHPLKKLLKTDGLAVLRPSRSEWQQTDAKINILRKANAFVGLPYNYSHNIRNKMKTNCSTLVMFLHDEITFNISPQETPITGRAYVWSVSPDQIGQSVKSSDMQVSPEVELISYFDPDQEGSLIYQKNKIGGLQEKQKFIQKSFGQ
ncbi:MAG: YiiX/YebB-like N1pC/P60 family cysteine hydrolase [Pseudobdellovibrionaceae bacterium]